MVRSWLDVDVDVKRLQVSRVLNSPERSVVCPTALVGLTDTGISLAGNTEVNFPAHIVAPVGETGGFSQTSRGAASLGVELALFAQLKTVDVDEMPCRPWDDGPKEQSLPAHGPTPDRSLTSLLLKRERQENPAPRVIFLGFRPEERVQRLANLVALVAGLGRSFLGRICTVTRWGNRRLLLHAHHVIGRAHWL